MNCRTIIDVRKSGRYVNFGGFGLASTAARAAARARRPAASPLCLRRLAIESRRRHWTVNVTRVPELTSMKMPFSVCQYGTTSHVWSPGPTPTLMSHHV
jgi:hypothetical protein